MSMNSMEICTRIRTTSWESYLLETNFVKQLSCDAIHLMYSSFT